MKCSVLKQLNIARKEFKKIQINKKEKSIKIKQYHKAQSQHLSKVGIERFYVLCLILIKNFSKRNLNKSFSDNAYCINYCTGKGS